MVANPLGRAEITAIRKAIYTCNQCEEKVEKMKAAGIPCEDEECRTTDLMNRLALLNAVYGMDQPTIQAG